MHNRPFFSRKNLFTLLLVLLYAAAMLLILGYILRGYDYYLTPLAERPRHTDYTNLKPGGLQGHEFGIIGGIMLILLMLYSLRKRTRLFHHFGMVSRWLDLHIFLGISGPLFIILHSSFKINGLAAVGFWAMIVVAVSGFFGRFLYLQIPRTIAGTELSLEDAEKEYRSQGAAIQREFQLSDTEMMKTEAIISGQDHNNPAIPENLAGLLIFFIRLRWRRFFVVRRLRQILPLSIGKSRYLVRSFSRRLRLQRRIQVWRQIHRLFEYWHVFHKPFAVMLYLIMLVHVVVVVWLGYTWRF